MIYDGQRKQPYYECDKDNERAPKPVRGRKV